MPETPASNSMNETMSTLAMHWATVRPQVRAYVKAAVGHTQDCEDVLQETIRHIVEHHAEYDPSRPFVAWAIGIAKLRVFELRHRRDRDRKVLNQESLDHLAEAMAQLPTPDGDDRRDALEQCLSQLPDKHWQVIRWRYYENISVQAIADRMQAKPNALSALLRRVRLALAECVERRLAAGGVS